MDFTPSKYQRAIFEFGESGEGNCIVDAVPGSGKTVTAVELANRLNGSIISLAFNKHIATALQEKMPDAECRTNHSLGLSSLKDASIDVIPNLDNWKYSNIVNDVTQRNSDAWQYDYREITSTAKKVADLLRLTVTDLQDRSAIKEVIAFNGIDYYGPEIDIAIESINKGNELWEWSGIIDFTDMLYLPVVKNYSLPKYDHIIVDESQDLNPAQLELIMRLQNGNSRYYCVGDYRQSIFGFAAADPFSMDKIKERTNATTLPLSICYRCPSSHIELAQKIYSEIEPRDNAPVGVIEDVYYEHLVNVLRPGDSVICRITAPLITLCFELISEMIPARVRGRDIGKGLISVIKKVADRKDYSWRHFLRHLNAYKLEQVRKLEGKNNSEGAVGALLDKTDSIEAAYMGAQDCNSERDLVRAIERLFSDEAKGVYLSTVHRYKGLENDRVFILNPEKMPLVWENQLPWQRTQEMNIKFVALTRSKEYLGFIR